MHSEQYYPHHLHLFYCKNDQLHVKCRLATSKMRFDLPSAGNLPVVTRKDELLGMIENNTVTVVKADTGSGKSTSIPILLLDEYLDKHNEQHPRIVVTQPRRMAATGIAGYVDKLCGDRKYV